MGSDGCQNSGSARAFPVPGFASRPISWSVLGQHRNWIDVEMLVVQLPFKSLECSKRCHLERSRQETGLECVLKRKLCEFITSSKNPTVRSLGPTRKGSVLDGFQTTASNGENMSCSKTFAPQKSPNLNQKGA